MDRKEGKILIIGVGGIGSYLVGLLAKIDRFNITVADPDIVEEKNLSYQNFGEEDVGKNKALVMKEYFNLYNASKYPILTKKQLEGYDIVVCCADNLDVRRLVYRQGFGNDETAWLDLRAQGRNGALISYLTNGKYSDTFLSGPEGSFSCQGEGFNNTRNVADIHFTHTAIAGMGAQWLQRWFNNERVTDKLVINV